jgi:hypothetical protein
MKENELQNNESGVVSSVGSLGVDVQSSNDRVRWTYQYEPISDLYELIENFEALDGTRNHEGRSRGVFRSVVEESVLREVVDQEDTIIDNIEVAFPLEGTVSNDLWLVGLARNNESRVSYHPLDQIVGDTESSRERRRPDTVLELFRGLDPNFMLQTVIHDTQIDDLHNLWGNTFGWTREGVVALQRTLNEQDQVDPLERQTWFSGVAERSTGRLVGASTAERLQLRERNGNMVDLIESTEWDVDPNFRGHKINASSISFLNSQIYTDLNGFGESSPTIFAECNFGSRSDMSAHNAGFSIPDRSIFGRFVSQANLQNVVVNDGILPDDAYRDFTLNVVRAVDRQRMYPRVPITHLVQAIRQQE